MGKRSRGQAGGSTVQRAMAGWVAWWLGALIASLGLIGNIGTLNVETSKAFVALVGVALGAVGFALDRRRRAGLRRVAWPVALIGGLWAYLLVVSLVAGVTYLGLFQLVKAAGLFALVVMVASAGLGVGDLRVLGRLVALALVATLLYALIGAMEGLSGYWGRFGLPLELTFGNQNMFGAYLVMMLALALPVVVADADRRWRGIGIAGVVSGMGMVFATQSRMMIAAMFVVGGVFLAGYLWRGRGWGAGRIAGAVAGFIALTAVLTLIVIIAQPRLKQKVGQTVGGESTHTRAFLYRAAGDLITDGPAGMLFGHGSGRFRGAFNLIDSRDYGYTHRFNNSNYIHNEWLEVAFEGGLVGFALFLAILGATLGRAWRTVGGSQRGSAAGLWSLAFAAGIVGFLTIGLASVATRYSGAQVVMAICIGGIWSLAPSPTGRRATEAGAGADAARPPGADAGRPMALPMTVAPVAGVAVVAAGLMGWFLVAGITMRDETVKLMTFTAESPERSFAALGEVRVMGVGHPDAMFSQLRVAADMDEPAKQAAPIWARLQRQVPHMETASHRYGTLLLSAGRYAEAQQVLAGHVEASPMHFEGQLDRNVAAWLAGDRQATAAGLADMIEAVAYFLSKSKGHGVATRIEGTGDARTIVILRQLQGSDELAPGARLKVAELPGYFMGRREWSVQRLRAHLAGRLNGLFGQLGLPAMDFGTEGGAGDGR